MAFRKVMMVAVVLWAIAQGTRAAQQDSCDIGAKDTIIVGTIDVSGPLWPDSIGVPVYVWADEDIAGLTWGLKSLDSRVRVSSFSPIGSVLLPQYFIPFSLDTTNNRIGFGWSDFTGLNPAHSPQGLIGTVFVKPKPEISVGEVLSLDSVSVGIGYPCQIISRTLTGSTCEMRYNGFDNRGGNNLSFGEACDCGDLYFSFDEGGGLLLYDRSGHKKDGTFPNAPNRPTWRAGVAGSALEFDGIDDWVFYGSAFGGSPNALTVSLWVREFNSAYEQCIAEHGRGWWQFYLLNGTIGAGVFLFSASWYVVSTPLESGASWHHVVMTWIKGSGVALYVDGDSISQLSVPAVSLELNTPYATLGSGMGPSTFYHGGIDEFRVYTRALSSQEILAEYWRVDYHRCGDVNDSRHVNLADIVYLVGYIFTGGQPPGSMQAGDVNCSGQVNLADCVYLINYIFLNGSVPCASCPY